MNLVLLILGIVLVLGLVVIHEMGHFWVAKRNGVTPLEFGIFFPPRLYAWKTKSGIEISLNLLPLGGFVRLKGEHDTDTATGSFGAASLWVKVKIMLAGITVNLAAAFILFTGIALVGLPQLVPNQFSVASDAHYVQRAHQYIGVADVTAGSPAAGSGIKPNDAIIAFGQAGQMTKITADGMLPKLTHQFAGQTAMITYRIGGPNGREVTKTVLLRTEQAVAQAKKAGKNIGYLGVEAAAAQDGITTIRSTWSAPIVAAGIIGQFTALTFQGLGTSLQGVGGIVAGFVTHNTTERVEAQKQAASQVAGPVGIFYIFKYGSTLGLTFMLFLVAFISM